MASQVREKPVEQAIPLVPLAQAPSLGVLQTIVEARLKEQEQAKLRSEPIAATYIPSSALPPITVEKEEASSSIIDRRIKEVEIGIKVIEAIKNKNVEALTILCKENPNAMKYVTPEGNSIWSFAMPANPHYFNVEVEMIGVLIHQNVPYKENLCRLIHMNFKAWEQNNYDPTAFILNLVKRQYIDPEAMANEIARNENKRGYNSCERAVFQELCKTCGVKYEAALKEVKGYNLREDELKKLTGLPKDEYRKVLCGAPRFLDS